MYDEPQTAREPIYNPFEDLPPELILDIMNGTISLDQEQEE